MPGKMIQQVRVTVAEDTVEDVAVAAAEDTVEDAREDHLASWDIRVTG